MQKIVDAYVKVCAQRKALKVKEDELRDQLILFLRKHKCPASGPYMISLTDVERTEFKWEIFAKKLLKKFGYPVKEIKSMIKAEKKKAGFQIVPTLHIDVNPKWKD